MNLGLSGPIAERDGVVEKGRRGSEVFEQRPSELRELLDNEGGILYMTVQVLR